MRSSMNPYAPEGALVNVKNPPAPKNETVYELPVNPSPSNALFATPEGLMVDAELTAALRLGVAVPDKMVTGKYILSFDAPRVMIQIPEDADRLSLVHTKWSGQLQEVILQRPEGYDTNITLDWAEGITFNGIEGPSDMLFGPSNYIEMVRHSENDWSVKAVDLPNSDVVVVASELERLSVVVEEGKTTLVDMEDAARRAEESANRVDLGALDSAVQATSVNKALSEQYANQTNLDSIAVSAAMQSVQLAAVASKAFSAPLLADAVTMGIAATTQGQGFHATGDDVTYIGLYERGYSGAAKRAELPKVTAVADRLAPIVQLSNVANVGDAYTATFPTGFVPVAGTQVLFFPSALNTTTAPTLNGVPIYSMGGLSTVPVGFFSGGRPFILRYSFNSGVYNWRIMFAGNADLEVTKVTNTLADKNAPVRWLTAAVDSTADLIKIPTPSNWETAQNAQFRVLAPADMNANFKVQIGSETPMDVRTTAGSTAPNIQAGDVMRNDLLTLRISGVAPNWNCLVAEFMPSGSGKSLRDREVVTKPAEDNSTSAASTAFVKRAVDRLINDNALALLFPNAFGEWQTLSNWVLSQASRMSISSEALGGIPNVCITTEPGADGGATWTVPITNVDGLEEVKKFSCSLVMSAIEATSGPVTTRVLLQQFNASSTEITAVRQTYALPSGGVAVGETLVSFSNVDLHEDARYIRIFISAPAHASATTPRKMWFRSVLLAAGASSVYRAGESSTNPKTVTVGVGGDYSDIPTALSAIGGTGTIRLLYSRDYGPEQRINPVNITGPLRIIGTPYRGKNPLIRLNTPLTGGALHSGSTKVWRYPVAGFNVSFTPQWIWIDDLEDQDTLIANEDRRPHHKGRRYRMPSTKCKAATATTLSEALIEMETSNAPKVFYDGGYLYVTGPNGLDLSTRQVYVDAPNGLFNTASIGSKSMVEIYNLDTRYGGINLKPFNVSRLGSVYSLGSRDNAIDYYGNFHAFDIECAGAAVWGGLNGDGLNGHTHGNAVVFSLYSHDNYDDGESTHENGSIRMYGSLLEQNGGTGVAPAYGCDAVYYDCESLNNQRRGTFKLAGFQATGLPENGGPAEDGYDTLAYFINCISRGDRTSFYDGYDANSGRIRAVCINCISENATSTAFYVWKIKDCRIIGSPSNIKRPTTIVENSALVS